MRMFGFVVVVRFVFLGGGEVQISLVRRTEGHIFGSGSGVGCPGSRLVC